MFYSVGSIISTADWLTLQLAKKHHPDGNKGDAGNPRKFTEIGEAYEVRSLNYQCHCWYGSSDTVSVCCRFWVTTARDRCTMPQGIQSTPVVEGRVNP